jgi:vacuolar protein-sorting-associated protein 4
VKELNNTKKDPNDMTEEAQAYRRLLNNLEVCQPKVPMSDVIGQKHAIQLLQDKLVDKHIRPDFFKKSNTTGALLYGPPGNGKTTIATAIATVVAEASEGNMPFFIVSAADFTSKYVGQAEITLTAMFKLAQMNGPSIMFIDEVEQLFKSRTEGGNSSGTGVVQSFLTNMSTYRDVFFIAATNFPWYIDDALLRRMCPTYIRMPTKTDRLQLLKKLFAEDDHYLLKKDFETIAEKTEGFSFDDISKLKDEVDNTIMMITKEAKHFKQTPRMEHYEISWTPCMEYEEGATPKNYRSMVTKNNPEGLVHPSITMAVVEHALTLKAPTNSQEQIELQDLYFDKGKSGVEERLAEKEKSKSRKG